ncbi:MAG: hypothetical protein MPJ50_10690 [Pirellulales bacterium]|nr:hypothetical protein [Pirellulales bacterium]
MRSSQATANRRSPATAGSSRWYVFAIASLSVFLLGIFLLGDAASSSQAEVELRLITKVENGAVGRSFDSRAIAQELAAELRPDPTRDVSADLAAELDENLALLRVAEIRLDQSESPGGLVLIRWSAASKLQLETELPSSEDFAARLTNASYAFAKAISNRARQHAASHHLASGERLHETTSTINRLEQNLEQLLESKLTTGGIVSPISYQTSLPGMENAKTQNHRKPMSEPPPGLMINDFAGELASTQDAERLREMKLRLINERTQLLQDMTEKHPDVLRKDKQIAYVQERLDALPIAPLNALHGSGPRFQDASAEFGSASSERVDELMGRLQSMQQGQETLLAEWRSRMLTLNQLKQERDEQLKAERLALTDCVNLAGADLATVESVRLSREIIPGRWALIAGVLVLGSVVSGGSLVSWGKRCAATFASVEEVRMSAGIPIVGTISSTEADVMPPAARSRRMFRAVTFLCEMFLAVSVLWVIVLAIADAEYRALLLDNPLVALLETCARSWQLLLG